MAITSRPIRAVAPKPMTLTIRTNRATHGTAQDSDLRTWRALFAVYMRMVMWGRQAPPRTTVSSEVIMSRRGLAPPANWRPERR